MIDEWSTGSIMVTEVNLSTLKKPAPLPLCPPYIPHELAWD